MGKRGANNKGKSMASSSSPQQERASKNRKLVVQHEPIAEVMPDAARLAQLRREQTEREEQARRENPRAPPIWNGGPLTNVDDEWQEDLFDWKMNKNVIIRMDGFMCEKEINVEHFRPFGLVQKFEALGWEAALGCYDGEKNKVYMDAIQEWVGSLKLVPGSKPPETMRLDGWVGDVDVSMSLETLSQIARFDSKEGRYVYPSAEELYHPDKKHKKWSTMLKELFEKGKGKGEGKGKYLKKDELKIQYRLLLTFVQQNVLPRRSDRSHLRDPDVPMLYALVKGKPKISYRYLVMMNIWTSRNSHEKRLIPHCRLITALLKSHGAINVDSKFSTLMKGHNPFLLDKLGSYGWEYVKTDRYHKLKSAGKKWRALRPDAKLLLEGEEDEADSGENVMGDSDGEDAEEVSVGDDIGTSKGVYSGPLASQFDDYHNMDEFVVQARPSEYSDWPDYAQALFDQNTRGFEHQRRDTERMYDMNEQWHKVHAYNFQDEINMRFADDQNRRMHAQWRAGEKVVPYPPNIDFSTLPPREEEGVDHPVPPVHHSRWVNPHQQAEREQGGSGSGGVFNTSGWLDTMTRIFGEPRSPYS